MPVREGNRRSVNCEENLAKYKRQVREGHAYKLCPFSTGYYTRWGLSGGEDPGDPRGNSRTYPYGGAHPAGVSHPRTDGGMITSYGGKFMCRDTNCPFYVLNGYFFSEQ